MMRASCQLVETAADRFVESWRNSGEPETAALDAERLARSLAAQDVRTLISLDGGRTLIPYAGRFEKIAGSLVGYLAVKLAGYWADLFVTVEQRPSAALRHAAGALDAVIAAVKPGARAGDLFATAAEALGPYSLHPALNGRVGHGIGLSLDEPPHLCSCFTNRTGRKRRLRAAGRHCRRRTRQRSRIGDCAQYAERSRGAAPFACVERARVTPA